MKRLLVVCVVIAAALALVPAAARPQPVEAQRSQIGQCGLPSRATWWIDYADGQVPFWSTIFRRPGVIAAASNFIVPPQLRAGGAKTIFWDMYLRARVGTPSEPLPAENVIPMADRMFERAAASSGCGAPIIALNEMFGANLTTPWSATNTRYRANLLAYVKRLSELGARPFLLLSTAPYTGGEAAAWWREAAKHADLVREVYFPGTRIDRLGPVRGSRLMRDALRRAVTDFTSIGVPANRVGLMLGFMSRKGIGGREGLEPAHAWFDVVKLEALAAKHVARETGISSVWSWGWAAWSDAERDPDKEAAACVWLWVRDPKLCDAPAKAGPKFDTSLTEGQIVLPRDVQCTVGDRRITGGEISAVARVTGDREAAISALYRRAVESGIVRVDAQTVLRAERELVRTRFGGSRSAYVAALRRDGATVTVARGIIADELRRIETERSLRVAPPSAAAVRAYHETYRDVPARAVEAKPAPRWLGGRTSGVALESLAPRQVFAAATGARVAIRTAAATYAVRVVGPSVPLGSLPLSVARPAILAALRLHALDDRFSAWSVSKQIGAGGRTVCRNDDFPAIAAVDLTQHLPFLALRD
jgi:hypothetical protein